MCRKGWDKASAKLDYVQSSASMQEIADKYGVTYPTVRYTAIKDNWDQARDQVRNDFYEAGVAAYCKSAGDSSSMAAASRGELYALATAMLKKLSVAMDDMALADMIAAGLRPREITGAMRDIMDILGVRSDADAEEQKARVEAIRARIREAEDTGPKEIRITMDSPELEKYGG